MHELIASLKSFRPTRHYLHENALARELEIKSKDKFLVQQQINKLMKAIEKSPDLHGDFAVRIRIY